jgi:hypothetical protein
VLASSEFVESAQLCRFLRHIVESRLADETDQLKESAIGVEVFRRGPNYDPKADPIVRVEARRLRARLGSYYETKGGADPVRISLPKGGYAPAFEILSAAPTTAPDPQPPEAVPPATPRSRWWILAAMLVLAAAVAIVVTRGGGSDRLVSRFWSSILDAGRPALVVPADSGLTMLQDLSHEAVPLRDYIRGEYRGPLLNLSAASETAGTFTERRYTSFADLAFAVRLARRPEAARQGILARYARDIRVEDLKRSNLILLGPRHMNPWVELFEKDATFRLEHDEKTAAYRVVNVTPGPGEIRETMVTLASVRQQIYGIVNYHRNPEGPGHILMLSGTSIAGTEAAADLILDDAKLIPWLRRALVQGEVKGFDMLLHGNNLAGSAPRAEVVAFHVDR